MMDEQVLDDLLPEEVEEFEELLGFMPHLPGFAPGEQFSGGSLRENTDEETAPK